jgi:predicted  nucleic acid-binding Zn-ribbon protein
MNLQETFKIDLDGRYSTLLQVEREAVELSNKDRVWFYRVIFNNCGYYRISLDSLIGDDERIISTYYKGERTL